MCPRRQHQARFRLRLPRSRWSLGRRTRNRLECWPLAPGGSLEDSLCSSSKPCLAARGSRCSPLASPWPPLVGHAALGRTARAAGWVPPFGRALARAQGGAREGASESAQMVLSVVVVEKPRVRSRWWRVSAFGTRSSNV